MPERPGIEPEVRNRLADLAAAHEHIRKADASLAREPDHLDDRTRSARALLRTIGRLLDEAGTPNLRGDRAHSDERTNCELRAVLSALDTPADRRAFEINTEVQALVTSHDFETNGLARERLRYLRDVLNSKDLD